jgi:mRNA interferase RelE/StbE
MYRVEIRSRAEKDIDALPSALSRRILDSIANLAAEPRPIGVQKLAAAGGYRVRVGDYRIVYEIADDSHCVGTPAIPGKKQGQSLREPL